MSKEGRISKKVEKKVKEYFAKINNDTKPSTSSIRTNSDQSQAN